ncbi:hypothetical protein EYC84_009749 [Monilinia fructicola]|uniref:Uncharacterized protein n=1 Tax=Monilinia fructicola TaxID=38448 RepID=A0A5M9JBG5_MONFR|nr:hypothetical protein EYC84_009749 [Monilinia fructicola]
MFPKTRHYFPSLHITCTCTRAANQSVTTTTTIRDHDVYQPSMENIQYSTLYSLTRHTLVLCFHPHCQIAKKFNSARAPEG